MFNGSPNPPGTGYLNEDADFSNGKAGVPAVVTPPSIKQTIARKPESNHTTALSLPVLGTGSDDRSLSGGSLKYTHIVDVATYRTEDALEGRVDITGTTIHSIGDTKSDEHAPMSPNSKTYSQGSSSSPFYQQLGDMFGDDESVGSFFNPPGIQRSNSFQTLVPDSIALLVPNKIYDIALKGAFGGQEVDIHHHLDSQKPDAKQLFHSTVGSATKAVASFLPGRGLQANLHPQGAPKNGDLGPPLTKYKKMDVLLGRGEKTNRHFGNIEFLQQKEVLRPRYLFAATRKEKAAIAQELVDIMQRLHGSRFLMQNNGLWYEVPNQRALEKAKQALRERLMTTEERKAKRVRYAAPKKPKPM